MTASAARSRPARARPAGRPRQAGRARSSRAGLILYVAGGSALSLAFLLPLAWAVARSFLPERLVTAAPSGQDVGHLTVSGYTGLLGGQIDILRNVLNSLVVAVGTSLLTLVVPGIATTVLYAFLFSWTEFIGALTFLTNNSLFTLPVALLNVEYGSVGQVNYSFLEAGAVIAMVPCLVLYVGLQRFYIRGLTSGVVK